MDEFSACAVIVSDVHIVSGNDEKAQMLLDVLKRLEKEPVEALILLGDIFDFCLGTHPYYQKKFLHIGRALERVVSSGTRVIFVEGNHEFALDGFAWQGVEFVTKPIHYIKTAKGQSIQLGHGDLIYSHERYKQFRNVVKAKWFTGAARFLPGWFMDWIATRSAALSRAQDEYREINHTDIMLAANEWLDAGEGSIGLFGHFHVPYAEKRRGGQDGGFYSVRCWDDKPNLLVLKGDQMFRIHLEQGKSWQLEKATSIFDGHG